MENTTPRGGQPSIQHSLMQSSRLNPDEFNQHVNKRFAKSFGTYSNDQKKRAKTKILVQNNVDEVQPSEKSRLGKPVNTTAHNYMAYANPNN